ncbi:UNVERIFIED_CONTAM: putative exosome complex component rrp40 [Sesamum latifolium]|uniref:Exosome complex component rrp40 n=1 Tax=Sesamum latifolium TaxID=2727402 RepID=A0AAW2UKC5_9LAMI
MWAERPLPLPTRGRLVSRPAERGRPCVAPVSSPLLEGGGSRYQASPWIRVTLPSPLPTRERLFPGDVVLDLSKMTNQTIKLGGGLRQDGDAISVMKAGKLRFSKPNKYWVESSHKRNFLVDIKGPMLAFLPVLAFEGGTRRNIPKFEMGTLLYVRVVKANTGMNPELSCTDASGKAAEYGPLKDGFMFESSTGLSRTLLSTPTCPVLETLGKKLAFEIAVGLNGRVWVNATSPSIIVLVANTIMQTESLSPAQQKIKVENLLRRLQ